MHGSLWVKVAFVFCLPVCLLSSPARSQDSPQPVAPTQPVPLPVGDNVPSYPATAPDAVRTVSPGIGGPAPQAVPPALPDPESPSPGVMAGTKKWLGVDALDLMSELNWYNISGNRDKFEQYSTPPQGFVIPRLWLMSGKAGIGTVAVDLVQPGRTDQNLFLQLFSPWQSGQIRFFDNMWREHPLLDATEVARLYTGAGINQPLWKGIAFQGHIADWRFRPTPDNKTFPLAPNMPYPNYDFKIGDFGAYVPVKKVAVTLRQTDTAFTDYTGEQPGTKTYETSAEAQSAISGRLSAAAGVSYTNVLVNRRESSSPFENDVNHQNQQTTGRIDLQGNPIDAVAVRGYFRITHDDRKYNISGYASNIDTEGIRLSWRGFPGLFVRTGFENRDISYLNYNHTTTFHPRVQSEWVDGRYSPIRKVELTARYSRVSRSDLPPSPRFQQTVFESPVTPSETTGLEFGVAFTPSLYWGVSYRLMQQRDVNPARDMILRMRESDLVGWFQPAGRIGLTLTYGQHLYDSGFLSPYLSNARVFTGELTYTFSPKGYFTASVSQADSDGFASVSGDRTDLAGHYRLNAHNEGVLEFFDGSFDDWHNSLIGYQANGFAVRWNHTL